MLVVFSGIVLLFGLTMKTTVSDISGNSVREIYNTGLLQDQMIAVILAGIGLATGILCDALCVLLRSKNPKNICWRCHGGLNGTPIVCQHCQAKLKWQNGKSSDPAVMPYLAKNSPRPRNDDFAKEQLEQLQNPQGLPGA